MTAKAFLASILCLSAVLTSRANAAKPEDSTQRPSAFALFERSIARKAATTILREMLLLDAAIDQWAIENNQPAGAMPQPEQLAMYLKKGSRLHTELSAGRCNDALGNPVTLRGVDSVPLLSKATVQQFAAVAEPGFWGPFYEGPELSTAPAPEPAPANPVTKQELRITALRLIEEMRMLDAAIDQWSIENNKPEGAQARPADLLLYIKEGTRLHGELAAGRTNDSLGNPIKFPPVGEVPTINQATVNRLAPAVPADFWGPYTKE